MTQTSPHLPKHKVFLVFPLYSEPAHGWWHRFCQARFNAHPGFLPEGWNRELNSHRLQAMTWPILQQFIQTQLSPLSQEQAPSQWQQALSQLGQITHQGQCWAHRAYTRGENDQGAQELDKIFLPSKDFLDPFYRLAGGGNLSSTHNCRHFLLSPALLSALKTLGFPIFLNDEARKRLGYPLGAESPITAQIHQLAISLYPGKTHALTMEIGYQLTPQGKEWLAAQASVQASSLGLITEANYTQCHDKSTYRSLAHALAKALRQATDCSLSPSNLSRCFIYTGLALRQSLADPHRFLANLARKQNQAYATHQSDKDPDGQHYSPFANIHHAFSLEGGACLIEMKPGDTFDAWFMQQTLLQSYLCLARLAYQRQIILSRISEQLANTREHEGGLAAQASALLHLNAQLFDYQQQFKHALVSNNRLHNQSHRLWVEALELEAHENHLQESLEQLTRYIESRRAAFWQKTGQVATILSSLAGALVFADNLLDTGLLKGLWRNIKEAVAQLGLSEQSKYGIIGLTLALGLYFIWKYVKHTGSGVSISTPDD